MLRRLGLVLLCLAVAVTGVMARGTQEEETPQGSMDVPEGRYNESPMLTALVAAGELPPVDERLPPEPMVRPNYIDGPGKYGGTLQVFAMGTDPWQDFAEVQEQGPHMLFRELDGSYSPDMMMDVTPDEDWTGFTATIREGIKWSDGTPITVEDWMFAYNDLQLNENVDIWQGFQHNGAEKIDDTTFHVDFKRPYPTMLVGLSDINGGTWEAVQPKHYLQKWHIDYNPDANELAQEEGYDFWYEALRDHFWWAPMTDIEKPQAIQWIVERQDSTARLFTRNPYYHRVDTNGNQLPYIDRIQMQIVDSEVYNLKIISGEADAAYFATSFENYTLYKENEDSGNYVVHELEGPYQSNVKLVPQWTSPYEAHNELFRMREVRQALSLAIDRDEINQAVFLGKGVPVQATIHQSAPFFQEEWQTTYIEYDPDRANDLLDSVGLTERNSAGLRIMPDGEPFQVVMEYPAGHTPGAVVSVLELVREQWLDIGIELLIRPIEAAMFWEREAQVQMTASQIEGIWDFRPGRWAWQWEDYYIISREIAMGIDSLDNYAGGEIPFDPPPAEYSWIEDYEALYNELNNTAQFTDEYNALATELLDKHAQEIPQIGTVGYVPYLYVARPNLKNIPESFPLGMNWATGLAYWNEIIYFD